MTDHPGRRRQWLPLAYVCLGVGVTSGYALSEGAWAPAIVAIVFGGMGLVALLKLQPPL